VKQTSKGEQQNNFSPGEVMKDEGKQPSPGEILNKEVAANQIVNNPQQ